MDDLGNRFEQTPFLDLLFNLLCCFVILFSLSFILINKEKKEDSSVKSKAELLITMTWDDELNDDIDLYTEDPLGHLVCFLRRDDGFLHLDRDDLGHTNDRIQLPNGEFKEIKINQEIITVRGIIEGEYCVNAFLYSKRSPAHDITKVKIKLEDINPTVKLITEEEKEYHQNGQEYTFFRFTLDKEGAVVNVNNLEKSLTKLKPQNYGGGSSVNYDREEMSNGGNP